MGDAEENLQQGKALENSGVLASHPLGLLVEAAPEIFEIKKQLFGWFCQSSGVLADDCIIATNTSSISITKLAATCGSQSCSERFLGLHFMNPVPVMPLVEVIRGLQTTDATLQRAERLAGEGFLGKTVTKSEDRPGFVANRVL